MLSTDGSPKATVARADVVDRNGRVFIDHQRDLGRQRVDAGHLAEHAEFVDDGRAVLDALVAATVDDDLAGVGVRCVIEHLGGPGSHRQPRAQVQQRTQADVFLKQLIGLQRAFGLAGQLGPGAFGGLLSVSDAGEVVAGRADPAHRHQQRPLDRMQHHRRGRAQQRGQADPGVRGHQQHRQRGEEQQPRQGGRALAEKRWRGAVQCAQWHVSRCEP
jgi:hypothetical protein